MNRTTLRGSTKRRITNAQPTGETPSGEFNVTVMVRRREELPSLAGQARMKPREKNHMSREQHGEQHGSDAQDIRKVETFAAANGLRVVRASAVERTVILSGSADAYNRAFGVDLKNYTCEGRTIRAREGDIYLPAELQGVVTSVTGLDNRPVAKPHFRLRREKPLAAGAVASSDAVAHRAGVPSGFTPSDIATLYSFPAALDGTGQTIAILELGGGFRPAELDTYFQSIGITTPNVTAVNYPQGGSNNPGTNALDPQNADVEVMLDIQVAGAAAPGAKLAVYFAPDASDQSFLGALNAIINDTANSPSVVSISWGGPESGATGQFQTEFDQLLQSAAHMGLTVCVAAGDSGSADFAADDPNWDGNAHVDFPASSPFALACGGTQVTAANGVLSNEVVWHDAQNDGTGGGVSGAFPLPTFQSNANVPPKVNPAGPVMRGVPDVAGDAAPGSGYRILCDGQSFPDPAARIPPVGGTSAVAPLWAALVARVNQGLGKPAGYLNPLLYNIQATSGAFRDITQGNNGDYSAGAGWDPCTGLGSPNGTNLLQALT